MKIIIIFFERESKLPRLYDFYEKFATYEIQQKYYILDLIYNIHLPIWLLLFSVFIIILKKNYRSILVILPLILLWLTYLLGPVSNFRYIIPIYVLYPMIIYLLLKKKIMLVSIIFFMSYYFNYYIVCRERKGLCGDERHN